MKNIEKVFEIIDKNLLPNFILYNTIIIIIISILFFIIIKIAIDIKDKNYHKKN